jgi:hypothetical protein
MNLNFWNQTDRRQDLPAAVTTIGSLFMLSENISAIEAPRVAEQTYEDEVCYELSLQLAENLSDIGACEYLREIRTETGNWLVTAVRIRS